MNHNTLFNNYMSRLKRTVLKRSFQRFLLSAILIYIPLASITLVLYKNQWFFGNALETFGIILAVSLLPALYWIIKERLTFMEELIGIETRLDLKSRISTAYEYDQSHHPSLYLDLLIKDACHILETIHPRKMFPKVLTRIHVLIPVFLFLFFFILLWDHFPYTLKKERIDDPMLQQISSTMKDFLKRETPVTKDTEKPHYEEFNRALEKMVKGLDENQLNQETLARSIQTLSRDVQAEQVQIARRIRATLNPGDIANTPMLKPLENTAPEADEIKKMEELLKELFQDEMPASLSTDISILERNSRLGSFLDQVLEELRSGRDLKNTAIAKIEKKGLLMGQTIPGTGKDDQKAPSEGMADENTMDVIQRDSTYMGPGRTRPNGEQGDNGLDDLDETFFPQAGSAKASGKEKAPSEMNNNGKLKIREQGISLTGERYSAQVRSLTIIGQTHMTETEILRTYEREVESVLHKEDIPLNYREYIKNYFLSIGIGREDHAKEHAD